MRGLRKVVVGAGWDVWPERYDGGKWVGGSGVGRGMQGRREEWADLGGKEKEKGKERIFELSVSRARSSVSGRETVSGGHVGETTETRHIKRQLELEIQGSWSPLAPLPMGVERTDILENTESITMRLQNSIPVIREVQLPIEPGSEDTHTPEQEGGREASIIKASAVDMRRSLLTALHEHPNIRYLKLILPVSMHQPERRAVVGSTAEPFIMYRHLSAPVNYRSSQPFQVDRYGRIEQEEEGWKHLDLQHDLVHLVRNLPARCRVDFVVPSEAEGQGWPGELRLAVLEQLQTEGEGQSLGSVRWAMEGKEGGSGWGFAKL